MWRDAEQDPLPLLALAGAINLHQQDCLTSTSRINVYSKQFEKFFSKQSQLWSKRDVLKFFLDYYLSMNPSFVLPSESGGNSSCGTPPRYQNQTVNEDVNNDGSVSSIDLMIVSSWINNTRKPNDLTNYYQRESAWPDVNGDCEVDQLDVDKIRVRLSQQALQARTRNTAQQTSSLPPPNYSATFPQSKPTQNQQQPSTTVVTKVPSSDQKLTTFRVDGPGVVEIQPGNKQCRTSGVTTSMCTYGFSSDTTSISLHAKPLEDAVFDRWYVPNSPYPVQALKQSTIEIPINQVRTVTAQFYKVIPGYSSGSPAGNVGGSLSAPQSGVGASGVPASSSGNSSRAQTGNVSDWSLSPGSRPTPAPTAPSSGGQGGPPEPSPQAPKAPQGNIAFVGNSGRLLFTTPRTQFLQNCLLKSGKCYDDVQSGMRLDVNLSPYDERGQKFSHVRCASRRSTVDSRQPKFTVWAPGQRGDRMECRAFYGNDGGNTVTIVGRAFRGDPVRSFPDTSIECNGTNYKKCETTVRIGDTLKLLYPQFVPPTRGSSPLQFCNYYCWRKDGRGTWTGQRGKRVQDFGVVGTDWFCTGYYYNYRCGG